VFVYPYDQTRRALDGIAAGPIDPHHGWKLRYVNPATGASPMPTIGAFATRLPSGFETRAVHCTDSTIWVCLEGEGHAAVGGETLAFTPGDVFVVPSWQPLQLRARRSTTLFSYSDRPVQQALGLWREHKA
jgi:gentisate 1,2-dioxygenase